MNSRKGLTDGEVLAYLKRRLAVFESEILQLDRSRDELKHECVAIRAEISRRQTPGRIVHVG